MPEAPSTPVEPELKNYRHLTSREQLVNMLAEAAEVEHNLMCCYLYAAFAIKTREDDGLTAEQLAATRSWRASMIAVSVEEMGHLALVCNLLCAVGGAAHLARMNFPIAPGPLPANMSVRLAPFDMQTLDHFIFLERPENSELQDSQRFLAAQTYERGPIEQSRLMPVTYDYQTVGALYQTIVESMETLSQMHGESCVFVGNPAHQVGPDITPLRGLMTVGSLADAKQAIHTIVVQGEGAPTDCGAGHFARFSKIKREYEALLAADSGFEPGRPVAENPVMRRPPTPDGKVWVTNPAAASVMDYSNALYIHALRLLAQAFGHPGTPEEKRLLVNAATELMYALTPAAETLTRLKANDADGCNAGMSFAMVRSVAPLPHGAEWPVLQSRFKEIVEAGQLLREIDPEIERSVKLVEGSAAHFNAQADAIQAAEAKSAAAHEAPPAPAQDPLPQAEDAQRDTGKREVVVGEHAVLAFDTGRCIHARFCVTGAPKTFLANVKGPWLHPDASDPALLSTIAFQCPSGAITLRRTDGGTNETAPQVNALRIRENGPLALHADLRIDGRPDGFRRTLCRCGQSTAKPYCDGSHSTKIDFQASGEPATRTDEPLTVRDGPLDVQPLLNGPLLVSGPLEVCSGTGRTVARTHSARLCRCGASANKPFCDNSHARVGFRSE